MTIDPAALPPGADEDGAAAAGDTSQRRTRYGRRRGHVPVGDAFVSRLGPSGDERFAAIDDDHDLGFGAKPSPDTPIEDLRFVALDCETTGQTPHRLVELGAVAFTCDRHLMSFETLVHSTDRINPFARRIHGISSETLGGAPPVDRVLERFRVFIEGAVLVEHSADAFDTRLISRTLREPLDNDNIDTSRLAGKLWGLKDTIGLERLCQQLNVHHRRPHHALADAEATAECFLALIDLGREQFGWRTLGDLLADGQPPPPRPPQERTRRRAPATGAATASEAADDTGAAAGGAPRRRRRRGGRRHRGGAGGADAGATDAPASGPTDAASGPTGAPAGD